MPGGPTCPVSAGDIPAAPSRGQLDEDAEAVSRLLGGGVISTVFQPIIDLSTGSTVAYEALSRGPGGHDLESPTALFTAARSAEVLSELDATCLRAAVGAARSARLAAPWTLFVNVEPDSHSMEVLPTLAPSTFPVVVELTERALTADPAGVLDIVELVRRLGWGVALDDVGVNPDSLALLPLIGPDVIKLDATLVQRTPDEHTALVFSAVAAEVERTGCIVLAEGIETPRHLQAAVALGAHLGQGWLFDHPGPLPSPLPDAPRRPLQRRATVLPRSDLTPFCLAAEAREVRTTSKALLVAMNRHLERQAAAVGEGCLVLTTFQTAAEFTRAAHRYTALADGRAFVVVFGCGLSEYPARRVRGIALEPHEQLSREWNVVIIGPHFSAILVASEANDRGRASPSPDAGPEPSDEWRYVISHNRDLTVQAAGALMSRIARPPLVPVPSARGAAGHGE